MNTTHIKNLAIALEALSRVNVEGSNKLYKRVEDLLKDQLKKQEKHTPNTREVEDVEIPF